MKIPGFTAQASLGPTEGQYRTHPVRRPSGEAVPAMADLIMLDAYGSSSNSESVVYIPEDFCFGLRKCCQRGYRDCCIDYGKYCP